MSTNDPGLPDAVRRVMAAANLTARESSVVSRAARADVPGLIRQAKADALEEFAHNHVLNQTPGRMAEDLLGRAAKIREGA